MVTAPGRATMQRQRGRLMRNPRVSPVEAGSAAELLAEAGPVEAPGGHPSKWLRPTLAGHRGTAIQWRGRRKSVMRKSHWWEGQLSDWGKAKSPSIWWELE
jgi:hypothetical protein